MTYLYAKEINPMAAFKISILFATSLDGLTITLTDNSNYASNTEGYTTASFSQRRVFLYNSAGTLFRTVDFTGSSLTTTFTVTKDMYMKANSTYTLGVGGQVQGVNTYMSRELYDLQQASNQLSGACGCSGKNSLCTDTTKAREAINAATFFYMIDNAPDCQDQLDAANELITNVVSC